MSFRRCVTVLVSLALVSLCHLPVSTGQSSPAGPVITSLSGCPLSPVDNTTLLCTPRFVLTVIGSGFSLNDIVNIGGFTCAPYNVVADGSSLMCTVADAYFAVSGGYDVDVPVSVLDLSTHLVSNSITTFQAVAQQPVILSTISGCDGSGQSTNNCDLNSSVVTITGSGFAMNDVQPWYLVTGLSNFPYTMTSFQGPGTYPVVGGAIVLPLSYALTTLLQSYPPQYWPISSAFLANGSSGTMSLCFTHGNTASNCLALSYSYAPPNQPRPATTPTTTGFVTNSSLSVQSVTGCPTNYPNNGSTTGCTPSTYITFILTGSFPSPYPLYITVGAVRCTNLFQNGATGVSCSIPPEYSALQYDQWLPVVVYDMIKLQQSPPAYLVQFNAPVYPTLLSVTGCPGDGMSGALSTTGCDISTTITITGTGFVNDGVRWYVTLGVPGTKVGAGRTAINTYINGTTSIQIPTQFLYTIIGSSVTTTSTTVTLYIQHGSQIVGPAQISIPTPPLGVTQVSGCASPYNNSLTVAGCSPGVSVLTIQGITFTSVMTVTVGTQPCVLTSYTSYSIQCVVPVPYGVQPGVGYDLFVGNFAGNVTIPGAVSYTSSPTIVSITSPFCPPDFTWTSSMPTPLYCSPYGQLTLVGVYFQDLTTLTVNITSGWSALAPLTCGNLTYQSASELTCTLPPASVAFAQYRPQRITIYENSTFASNSFQSVLYTDPANQPNIVSVQGCASVDAVTRVASGCQVGDVLTLNGVNFVAPSTTTQVQLWSDGDVFLCSAPRVLSLTQMTCILPYLPLLAVDSVVPIRIASMNGLNSNWLVAINFNTATSTQSSSSGDTKFIISLAVLIPVVAVLLVMLGVVLVMKRVGGKQSGDERHTQGGGQRWSRHNDEKEDSRVQMGSVGIDTYSNEQ